MMTLKRIFVHCENVFLKHKIRSAFGVITLLTCSFIVQVSTIILIFNIFTLYENCYKYKIASIVVLLANEFVQSIYSYPAFAYLIS